MNLNPIVLSIPIFFSLNGLELLVESFTRKKLFRVPDTVANISGGITSQLSGLFLRVFHTLHYRAHHRRNPKYLDGNQAGSLIIWDRMWRAVRTTEVAISLSYFIISFTWFNSLQNQHERVQMA